MPNTKTRISVTIEVADYDKIMYLMKQKKFFSISQMANRLLKEALDRYDDEDQPRLELKGRKHGR